MPATVRRVAEQGIWEPVPGPGENTGWSFLLVFDLGPSMDVWRPTLLKLARYVRSLGTFRRVRLWALDTDRDPTALTVYIAALPGGRRPRRQPRPPPAQGVAGDGGDDT